MLVSPSDPDSELPPQRGFTRRGVLARGGAAALALGLGGLTLHQCTGYADPEGYALQALSAKEYRALVAANEVILAGLDPELVEVAAQYADGYVARQSSWLRRELKALLHLFEHAPPWVGGGWSRATRLDPQARADYLACWQRSSRSLLRQGYAGLKCMAFMGAYRDPRAWSHCLYGGPPPHPLRDAR